MHAVVARKGTRIRFIFENRLDHVLLKSPGQPCQVADETAHDGILPVPLTLTSCQRV